MYGWSKYAFLVVMCLIAALLILSSGGCKKASPYTETLTIQTEKGEVFAFLVDVANTPEKSEKGLMFRENLKENEGMLFYKEKPQEWIMWMKNTKISLDMIFFDENGFIVMIYDEAKPFSEKYIYSTGKVKGVLEIKGGIARKLGIKKGDRIVSTHLTSQQTQ